MADKKFKHPSALFNLTRYFSIASAVAIAIVTLILTLGYYHNAKDNLVRHQEQQNIFLTQSIANTFWPRFGKYIQTVKERNGDVLRKLPETKAIHKLLKEVTTGLPILKIKIYNLYGITVFSSQASQIGENKINNAGFF